jgi:phosphate-selective porin OprO/OprP
MTARIGGTFLYDYAAYDQDDDSKTQMSLNPQSKVRDSRFYIGGAFPKIPGLRYSFAYMYDGANNDWFFRTTGLQYEVPKLHGRFFLGRQKEGYSTSKVMTGTDGWGMERSTSNDAFLPILADGLKWTGNSPDGRLVYNLGYYMDELSNKESFNKNDSQFISRAVWLPFLLSNPEQVLHLAVGYRYGKSNDGFLQYRSKPEANPAQDYAIDTGKFAAQHSDMAMVEAYYRPGPLMFGMEYIFNQVASRETGDPFFHGGEVFVAYTPTGEVRPYNTKGGYFGRISPNRTVFEGGPGAWELVLRYSYTDLDSKSIQGGKFWRITPGVNWHMNDNVRLEFFYGYGMLDRFNTEGATHFFQTRIQFQL